MASYRQWELMEGSDEQRCAVVHDARDQLRNEVNKMKKTVERYVKKVKKPKSRSEAKYLQDYFFLNYDPGTREDDPKDQPAGVETVQFYEYDSGVYKNHLDELVERCESYLEKYSDEHTKLLLYDHFFGGLAAKTREHYNLVALDESTDDTEIISESPAPSSPNAGEISHQNKRGDELKHCLSDDQDVQPSAGYLHEQEKRVATSEGLERERSINDDNEVEETIERSTPDSPTSDEDMKSMAASSVSSSSYYSSVKKINPATNSKGTPSNNTIQGIKPIVKTLNILQLNISSLNGKKTELRKVLMDCDIGVACIQESRASSQTDLRIKGYDYYPCKGCPSGRCRGNLIYTRTGDIVVKSVEQISKYPMDVQTITLKYFEKEFHIYNVYRSPSERDDNHDYLRFLEEMRTETIILGDFNAHSPKWEKNLSDGVGEMIETLCAREKLTILQTPQSYPTLLHVSKDKVTISKPDLSICSSDLKCHADVLEGVGSDHRPILVKVEVPSSGIWSDDREYETLRQTREAARQEAEGCLYKGYMKEYQKARDYLKHALKKFE